MIIDLSSNNGVINYGSAKSAGVDGVILRATMGVGTTDKMLDQNSYGFNKIGVSVSYYHFAYPKLRGGTVQESAVLEATSFSDAIKPLAKPVRVWVDLEPFNASGLDTEFSQDDYSLWLQTYFDTVKSLTGYDPGIYTYADYLNSHLPDTHSFGNRTLWIANYSAKSNPPIPKGFKQWHLWQYSESGSIPGIDAKVDLNRLAANIIK